MDIPFNYGEGQITLSLHGASRVTFLQEKPAPVIADLREAFFRAVTEECVGSPPLGQVIRPGDKVMQVKNDYQIAWTKGTEEGQGAFNGDIGFVEAADPEERTLTVRFDDDRVIEYTEAEMDALELSYCISVHKSQGSEFEAVVLPLSAGPPVLLTRNLLYTAVTRAKRLVVVVGREDVMRRMVESDRVQRRFSALSERLRALLAV